MTLRLSQNTQAILLLAAPLLTGARKTALAKPLSLAEYKSLVGLLRAARLEPADLLGSASAELIARFAKTDELRERLTALLARGFLLSEAVELWASRSIWVMSRADAEYPARLKAKLGQDAPPVLYGCGDRVLLDAGGVAVVGSRDAGELETAFAVEVGRCAAAIEAPVVSGGARGIDQAGVGAALESGGKAIAILADNLGRAVVSQAYRPYLRDRRLTLVSPFDPLAGFTVGHAMQRNKLIYAFADVAFVASSAFESGGTWSGAVEQLDKLRFAPVYVRHDESSSGLRGLREKGALVAPKSITPEILRAVLVDTASRARDPSAKQRTLAL